MNKPFLLFSFFLIILFSCKKEELVTITGNEAPEDTTISVIKVENYINRAYILALSREPDSSEFLSAKTMLINSGVSPVARENFISNVLSNQEFSINLYNINKELLLNNPDTADFTNWITIWNILLLDSTNMLFWPVLHYEIDRMTSLRQAYSQFVNGSISLAELQRRMCNNYIYDQINMGSANFVISTFQLLLSRNPTLYEEGNGISMVNGNNAVLFLLAGYSKEDYLNILTGSNNYYESQAISAYKRYLNRIPVTLEMSTASGLYRNLGYVELIKSLLVTDEFIGI